MKSINILMATVFCCLVASTYASDAPVSPEGMASITGDKTIVEIYFVFDAKALQQYITWGQASSMEEAKKMAAEELDYMITEINIHLASLEGLDLEIGRRDVTFMDDDAFTHTSDDNKSIPPKDALRKFKDFLNEDNGDGTAQERLQYDIAMLLTGYNLGGAAAGFGDVSAVCMKRHGAGVVEFRGIYSSVILVSHEIGHILGAYHDKRGDGHIMSPATVQKSPKRWSFSRASHEKISKKLQALDEAGNKCLKETNTETEVPTVRVPEAISTPDGVCQRAYGIDAFSCRWSQKTGDQNCFQIFCDTMKGKGSCYNTVPSDGMACGKGKSCRSGTCISDPEISQDVDDSCTYGDMKKVIDLSTGNYVKCEEFIKSGKGKCNLEQDRVRCCKTCKDLPKTKIKKRPCKDLSGNCDYWANLGYCTETYVNYMKQNCPSSCGHC